MSGHPGAIRSITPSQLHELAKRGDSVEVIDVRTPAEFRSVHIPLAQSQPLDSLDPRAIMAARPNQAEPLYVICRSGSRSAKACSAFEAAGFGDRVVNVEGGTLAWEQAGLPVERGRSVMPLDRQVRTAIGVLVLLGVLLGALVNPWFYGLSAFCGAGLVYAGLTDCCPLAWTMAKMPWNRAGNHAPTCSVN